MKFKVPDNCRIGGADYRVRREALEDHKLYGQCRHTKREIVIANDLPPDASQVRETFLHEAIHVIDELYDLNLRESQVRRMAHGLDELVQQLEPEE